MENMFCYQCEQAAKGTGCSAAGVCGKTPEVSNLQDLLIYAVKGVSFWANLARENGASNTEVDHFVKETKISVISSIKGFCFVAILCFFLSLGRINPQFFAQSPFSNEITIPFFVGHKNFLVIFIYLTNLLY